MNLKEFAKLASSELIKRLSMSGVTKALNNRGTKNPKKAMAQLRRIWAKRPQTKPKLTEWKEKFPKDYA